MICVFKMLKENKIVLRINNIHVNTLKKIVQNAHPNESVALLFGTIEKTLNNKDTSFIYTIQKIDEMNSSDPSPVAFVLNDYETIAKKWMQAQSIGLKLTCIFHSHPSNAQYSGTDEKYMSQISELYPEIPWLIYGNHNHEFKCYLYQKNKVHEVRIEFK
jgi:proteasome lid subunit RPN8/RPN11